MTDEQLAAIRALRAEYLADDMPWRTPAGNLARELIEQHLAALLAHAEAGGAELARLRKAARKLVGEWDRDEEAYDVFAVEQAIRQLRAALRAEGRAEEAPPDDEGQLRFEPLREAFEAFYAAHGSVLATISARDAAWRYYQGGAHHGAGETRAALAEPGSRGLPS